MKVYSSVLLAVLFSGLVSAWDGFYPGHAGERYRRGTSSVTLETDAGNGKKYATFTELGKNTLQTDLGYKADIFNDAAHGQLQGDLHGRARINEGMDVVSGVGGGLNWNKDGYNARVGVERTFGGPTMLDANAGYTWHPKPNLDISAGTFYRQDLSGPYRDYGGRVGVGYQF